MPSNAEHNVHIPDNATLVRWEQQAESLRPRGYMLADAVLLLVPLVRQLHAKCVGLQQIIIHLRREQKRKE